MTAGSDRTDLTISASVNTAKGNEKGNNINWKEITIDAGSRTYEDNRVINDHLRLLAI
ncbi:hypothetical protein [Winslowiella arboricola]|uniref:hypothetical protein n=1 Tax=Winslowiella arboricola TaxID=2978220 RepID=UPI00396A8DDD